MAPTTSASRRTPTGRRRGRPPGTTNAARVARQSSLSAVGSASEPPLKRRRFAPGALPISTHLVANEDAATPSSAGVSRARAEGRGSINASSPSLQPRRSRSTRAQGAAAAADDDDEGTGWGSAAAMAASVKQAEDYKPREERGWEEFHPNLDIETPFLVFRAEEVDGLSHEAPPTPAVNGVSGAPANGSDTPSKPINPASTGNTPNPQAQPEVNPFEVASTTPSRRPRRATRDAVSFYTPRPTDSLTTPKVPRVLPIQNQTPKERLDLKLPSYRKTNRVELFESKTFGQARYVDKAMSNVGYQESDHFIRSEPELIKAVDGIFDDDLDQVAAPKSEDHGANNARMGRVEYDMDEQDDMWLEQYNVQRKDAELATVTREVFEITMTKVEKEWHALEKRIPKPNPKPPQTHRPRSGSAAAVNGEQAPGEEPDSKCAICDDGDCENTNAIVFCDGCNLAVHQECYGVPFIPEGQWLCRKCQMCGRGVPTCIFCPNTDGAFKQTNSSKWAHLLCAMWIPEVSLGNHTFMEPVMEVEKVPKTRWKLNCYICNQKMGACIQCSNKNCYQAFHVTCARRARLSLKMKTSQGVLAVLDGGMVLKAYCDKHCPADYTIEHGVHQATRAAKKFYKRNMRGRIWADNHAMANVIAAQHRHAVTELALDDAKSMDAKDISLNGDKKKGQAPKNVWRLPSGAPVVPQTVFDKVEASVARFSLGKRKEFVSEACRYWTMKREARRGAALLKRLQLQMESFSSMELTRRNFASMGPSGWDRLARRVDFAKNLVQDLSQLVALSDDLAERERLKVEAAELEAQFVDECYFPVVGSLSSAIDKATSLDKNLFDRGLATLQKRVENRQHVTALSFASELGDVINAGINSIPPSSDKAEQEGETEGAPCAKGPFSDIRERRKLGRRIFKAVQPFLETGLRIEAEICNKPFESLQRELEAILDSSVDGPPQQDGLQPVQRDGDDTIMVDAPDSSEITVKGSFEQLSSGRASANGADTADEERDGDDEKDETSIQVSTSIKVNTSCLSLVNGEVSYKPIMENEKKATAAAMSAAVTSDTPPDFNGYTSAPRPQQQAGPPTPPQSNGSLGKDPPDGLAEGGILWYLKAQEPQGTSILEEHWADSDTARMLSEDLTDLDDEEFKGLGADVKDSVLAVATALPPFADADADAEEPSPSTGKGAKNNGGGNGKTTKRRASARRR